MTLRHLLAVNLRALRKERRLAQHELAKLAGCDQSFISQIEREGRDVTLGTVEALASALGVPAHRLLSDAPARAAEGTGAEVASLGGADLRAGVSPFTHSEAVATARCVLDVPEAARAIMDRWLDYADPTVESAELAGYTVLDPDDYLGTVAVGIQHPSEVCAVYGFPWRCP